MRGIPDPTLASQAAPSPLVARFRQLAEHGVTEPLRTLGQHALAIVGAAGREPARPNPVALTLAASRRRIRCTTWDEEILAQHLARYFGLAPRWAAGDAGAVELLGDPRLAVLAELAFEHLRGGYREHLQNAAWFSLHKRMPLQQPAATN